jgi:uncharacterized protein (TIGR00369 family)
MPLEPLDASRFGFVGSCFVCDEANPRGLQVPFFHDTDRELVVAMFELPQEFSGAPTYVHGGATLALLDEGMAWASLALRGKFAVTKETTARFDAPVRVGRPHRLEARIMGSDDRTITTEAVVLDLQGRGCATATATMVITDLDQLNDSRIPEDEGTDSVR